MRAQAHTLEAVAASILLLSGVVFALQATAVTPLTGSTSNQYIENQQRHVAEGVLASETDNGTLTEAVLYYNESAGAFHGASDEGYASGGPPSDVVAFGGVLNETFVERGIAVNVDVYFIREDGDRLPPVPMVHMGRPSPNAAIASQTLTLHGDDRVVLEDGTRGDVIANETHFTRDIAPKDELFNVVRVEVTVWRM
jgi:hypothetical protein